MRIEPEGIYLENTEDLQLLVDNYHELERRRQEVAEKAAKIIEEMMGEGE